MSHIKLRYIGIASLKKCSKISKVNYEYLIAFDFIEQVPENMYMRELAEGCEGRDTYERTP